MGDDLDAPDLADMIRDGWLIVVCRGCDARIELTTPAHIPLALRLHRAWACRGETGETPVAS